MLLCLLVVTLHAQQAEAVYDNTSLADALLDASKRLGIKVAFDASKLAEIKITRKITAASPNDYLSQLLSGSEFVFQYKHDRYLIVEKKAPPVPESITCRLMGVVSDIENGELLPFASIVIPSLKCALAASDNASFSIKCNANEQLHVNISYIGYYPLDTNLMVASNDMRCSFRLIRKLQNIEKVIVREPKIEMIDLRNDVDFATTINPSKLIDLPVLAETDIFKALQLLPGVSYSENSSDLSIRGGTGDQNLVLYDGQTLYNLSHFYGVFSAINPNIIKDIQIFKGGYDSRYGERVSGIVDITGKTGNKLHPNIYGDVNLISGNVAAEVPVSEKLTLIVAGRRSYADVYSTDFTKNLFANGSIIARQNSNDVINISEPSFYFYDYNAKLSYAINSTTNVSVNGYISYDQIQNAYSADTRMLHVATNDQSNAKNYGYSASLQKQWSPSFFSSMLLGSSGFSNKYFNNTQIDVNDKGIGRPNPKFLPDSSNIFITNNNNQLADRSLSLRNVLYINNYHHLYFGINTRQNQIHYHKDADTVYVYDNTQQSAFSSTFYVHERLMPGAGVTIKPGVRFTYYNGNHNIYFEPRLSVNVKVSEALSVRFATGRYYQFISKASSPFESGYEKSFWVMANKAAHPVVRSDHFVVGATYEAGAFLFDVEPYYKSFRGIQEYIFVSPFLRNSDFDKYFPPKNGAMGGNNMAPPPDNRPSYFISGNGKAYGIDFLTRYRYSIYTTWLSYSLTKSRYRFAEVNNNSFIPAPNDQTHQLSWANMLSIGQLNVGSILLFATGRPYLVMAPEKGSTLQTRRYKRLPNYFRSDLSANYNFKLGKIKLKAGATIINIFNTQNYFDVNNRKFDFENASFTETNLIRSQDLSFNLFLHFNL